MAHSAYSEITSPAVAPAKNSVGCMLITQGFSRLTQPGINLPQITEIQIVKKCDVTLKINFMSTLFVGINVSSKSNIVYAMDFHNSKYISSAFSNNQPVADELTDIILGCLRKHTSLTTVVVVLDSTSVYSIHIANLPYKPYFFCLNPKITTNYRKSFIDMSKTNPTSI